MTPEPLDAPPLWVLVIPEASPSPNAWTNKHGPHVYQALRSRWMRLLYDAWTLARAADVRLAGFEPPARAVLRVYRHSPRPLDPDNLVGGLKPILDGLRRMGLIADDRSDALTLDVRPVPAPKALTRLILEPWHGRPDV